MQEGTLQRHYSGCSCLISAGMIIDLACHKLCCALIPSPHNHKQSNTTAATGRSVHHLHLNLSNKPPQSKLAPRHGPELCSLRHFMNPCRTLPLHHGVCCKLCLQQCLPVDSYIYVQGCNGFINATSCCQHVHDSVKHLRLMLQCRACIHRCQTSSLH
jgi:hypothetical protein